MLVSGSSDSICLFTKKAQSSLSLNTGACSPEHYLEIEKLSQSFYVRPEYSHFCYNSLATFLSMLAFFFFLLFFFKYGHTCIWSYFQDGEGREVLLQILQQLYGLIVTCGKLGTTQMYKNRLQL